MFHAALLTQYALMCPRGWPQTSKEPEREDTSGLGVLDEFLPMYSHAYIVSGLRVGCREKRVRLEWQRCSLLELTETGLSRATIPERHTRQTFGGLPT